MKLLSVDDARTRILHGVAPLEIEAATLTAAVGRFLAEPVVASRDQPPFAASAMDGWAVRAEDGAGRRRVVGESAAGRGYAGSVGPGEAVRIFTGAAVPSGADAVVIQEEVRREGDTIFIAAITQPRHIRPAGLDFRAGASLLQAGQRLDPWRLALAAAAGRSHLAVRRRPRVSILATGEEVVEPGGSPGPFQIFNSGSTALAALVSSWGAIADILDPVGDNELATANAVDLAAGDLVVTLGGASVGDHDVVKPALGRLGLRLLVESVAVRPGKPTWFGLLADGRRVLGLPGNPASAMVCAELFLRPLIRMLQGGAPDGVSIMARTRLALGPNDGREHWMRAMVAYDGDSCAWIKPLRDQDSSLVTIFAEAGALVCRPSGAQAAGVGAVVQALILDRLS